ncbi:MAG: hypothetical protein ACK55Z_10930 [bacterium]
MARRMWLCQRVIESVAAASSPRDLLVDRLGWTSPVVEMVLAGRRWQSPFRGRCRGV